MVHNGSDENFHGKLRDEVPALEEFESLTAARKWTTAWMITTNNNGQFRF